MPSMKVEIKWDWPDDEGWMNVFNLKLALERACSNTKFEAKDLEDNRKKTDNFDQIKEVNMTEKKPEKD